MLAGAATVILLLANAGWVFSSRLQAVRAFVIFALLYTLIYLLLTLEDNALLVGAIASFLAVAAAMYFTRRIDWYSLSRERAPPNKPGRWLQGTQRKAKPVQRTRCKVDRAEGYT